ncbi:hypothetical protein HOLleu_44954 [Holothuria leucospilota]|uniref:Nose resistant-to-fluoxetine protein N-terminal domain-containing protein n=1 Tax=Holothuria leucospilota TaxID=206669 RepID=A0A9Q1BAL2_HOLLE|nr:hypothetical protein HOLleu_44954 [Holothuria leucospilota]
MHSTQCQTVLVISVMVLFLHSAVSQLSPEMIQGVVWPRQRIPVTDIQSHEVSSHCKRNLSDLPKAFDAFGKPAAGILVGNINWMGHFDECESLDGFQYCVVEFNVSVAQSNPVMPFMLYGVCAPENCSESDVYNSMDFFVERTPELKKSSPMNVIAQPICSQHPHRPIDGKFVATVAFFSFLFVLVIGSSLYHAWYHSTACRKSQTYHLGQNEEFSQPDTSPLVNEVDADHAKVDSNNVHVQTREEGEIFSFI